MPSNQLAQHSEHPLPLWRHEKCSEVPDHRHGYGFHRECPRSWLSTLSFWLHLIQKAPWLRESSLQLRPSTETVHLLPSQEHASCLHLIGKTVSKGWMPAFPVRSRYLLGHGKQLANGGWSCYGCFIRLLYNLEHGFLKQFESLEFSCFLPHGERLQQIVNAIVGVRQLRWVQLSDLTPSCSLAQHSQPRCKVLPVFLGEDSMQEPCLLRKLSHIICTWIQNGKLIP